MTALPTAPIGLAVGQLCPALGDAVGIGKPLRGDALLPDGERRDSQCRKDPDAVYLPHVLHLVL